jgi:hypothetical protein
MPAVIIVALVAVALASLLLLRLAGGSLPWGQLLIAVGPDGRPMRPRVKWHLWSISRGEPPRVAALGGLASVLLGCASMAAISPRLAQSVFHPLSSLVTSSLVFTLAMCCILIPTGFIVLLRGGLDLFGRRSTMAGMVVGMRRDLGPFGRGYRIALQPGDRLMARGLWAESFRVKRTIFDQLKPGDRIIVEYSPRLRFVYRATEQMTHATTRAKAG